MPVVGNDSEVENGYEEYGNMVGSDEKHVQVINIPQPRQRTNSFFAHADDTAFGSGDFFSPDWCDDTGMHESVDSATPMSIGRSISPDTNDFYMQKAIPDATSFARPRAVSGAGSW